MMTEEATRFLLEKLGISKGQLEILSRIRSITELDSLDLDEETQFTLRKPDIKRVLGLVLTGTMLPQDYEEGRIMQLLEIYELLSSITIRERRRYNGDQRFAFYFRFGDQNDRVDLYIRQREI